MSKIMPQLLLLNVAEVKKKRGKKSRCIQKILMIPESEISDFPEHEVKSKIDQKQETYLWTKKY